MRCFHIYFGNLINFEIKNKQLVAKLGGQISPVGGYIGDIQIIYIFKDKMYQVKSIEFIPHEFFHNRTHFSNKECVYLHLRAILWSRIKKRSHIILWGTFYKADNTTTQFWLLFTSIN